MSLPIQPTVDVWTFQQDVLGNPFPAQPELLAGEKLYQTLNCLDEEIQELMDAGTISDQADALVDLIYFAFGALYRAGVDADRVWTEVHRANMTKVRGITKRQQSNDAAKPDDWKAPDHSWLEVAACGK